MLTCSRDQGFEKVTQRQNRLINITLQCLAFYTYTCFKVKLFHLKKEINTFLPIQCIAFLLRNLESRAAFYYQVKLGYTHS